MPIYKYAGFWRRLVAYMIDNTIITIIFILLAILAMLAYFAGAVGGESNNLIDAFADPGRIASITVLIWGVSFCVTMAYFTYFHGATGRTPGKMILGLQVVGADGKPISFGIAFLRSVGYVISSIVFCLGYIWIGFDKRKQGWHDKIAGTVVIIRDPENNVSGLSIPDPAVPAPSALQNKDGSGETSKDAITPVIPPAEGQSGEKKESAGDQKIP